MKTNKQYPSRFLSIAALSSATMMIALPSTTSAAEASSQEEKPPVNRTVIESYTVAGSKEQAFSLPGSAYYLDTGDIENLNYQNVNQILQQVPGVYVREEDGYGNFPNISLRGVDGTRSSKVTLMEDGILTAPAPYSAPSAYYSPTVGRMAGLEVLKGSSQVRYGPETTGGVLNYISTPIPSDEFSAYGRLSAGNFEDFQSHLWAGGNFEAPFGGTLGVLGEFYGRTTTGFDDLDSTAGFDAGDADTGFTRADYQLRLSWEPDWEKPNRFEFKIGYTDFDADESYLGLSTQDLRADPYRRYAASRKDNIDTLSTRMHLRHRVDLSEDWQLSTTGYFQRFHRNWYKLNNLVDPDLSLSEALFDGTEGYSVLTGTAAGQLRYRANNRTYKLYGIQSDLNGYFETGDVSHEIRTGIRLHHDYEDRFQHQDVYNQNDQGVFVSVDEGAPGSQANRRSSTDAFAAYAEDRISMGDFSVIPGLRLESMDYKVENRNSGSTERADLTVLSPGVGLEYRLTEDVMAFGGYYRGFSAPGPSGAVAGVEEETSDSFEVGARYRNNRGFRAEAVTFLTYFNNLLVAESIGSGTSEDENIGEALSRGVEILVGADPARLAEKSFRTPLTLAVTYTDATLEGDASSADPESIFAGGSDGDQLPYIPEWQINLTSGFECQRLRGYASLTWVDSAYASANNSSAEVNPETGTPDARFGKVDSFTTLDLSLYYRLRDGLEIFVYGQNVLDEEYLVSRLPHGPRPGAPATYGGGLQASF